MSHPRILMLEYDQDDRYISKEFFSQMQKKVDLDFVTSPEEFLSHLETRIMPSLILMNQNASPFGAISLIREVKSKQQFRHIPIVILGDLGHDNITREYYEAGASSFIQKPVTYHDTQKKIEKFIAYWFETVELGK
jgi:CheY-like chemotaxis protein